MKLRNSGISDDCCRDEADAEIVPSALDHASVGVVNIRSKGTNTLVLLIYTHTHTHTHRDKTLGWNTP